MTALVRLTHVFAVALWFGSVVFFTAAGLLIFQAFEGESRLPGAERPLWFPLPAAYDRAPPGPGFPDPLRLEQGSRAAGRAVGKVFPFYYALQAGCAAVALLSAWPLMRRGGAAGQWRTVLATAGLAAVLGGWWLETEVSRLRVPRERLTDEVLQAAEPSEAGLAAARMARADFGRWHAFSLAQNFLTLLLTAGLVALLPWLPPPGRSAQPERADHSAGAEGSERLQAAPRGA